MAKTYKKWLVGTTAAVVVLGSLSFPQVQAAASDLLSMFRAEKFETIHMTAQDLEDLQNWMKNGEAGERTLEGLGSVTRLDGAKAPRRFDSLEAAKNAGYEVAPAPAGFTVNSVKVQPEFSMQFRLNTAKANGLLKSLGSTVTFDDQLNDQPFTVTFPRQTETHLVSKETDGLALIYSMLKTPHMEAPAGVDLNQLRTTILQLPMIPPNVAKQLARIEDWQNTVPLPYVEGHGNMEKVNVGGNEGIFQINQDRNSATLIWQKDGQLHNLSLQGATQISDLKSVLLQLAKTYN